MREQTPSDSLVLVGGADIGVANESHALNLLQAHHAFRTPASSQPQKTTPSSTSWRNFSKDI